MNIKTVTVLGANGSMGRNVAGIFASFGNAKVYMVCRSLQDAKNAKMVASKTVKAETIDKNLIAKTYDDLEECISNSDFVFESVAESMDVKKHVYSLISSYLTPNTIIGTGTSGLSINELSKSFDLENRKNYLGIHMFNPPYNMTLCEVIPSEQTSKELLEDMKRYLKTVLYRDVVEVNDEPAFMGNRIGFQFINEALQYAELYKESGGIDYIDAILGGFTGRSMPPLVTSDFVGLDVHKAIVDNVYEHTKDFANETFKLPNFAEELIAQNKLGRKTGVGLYRAVTDKAGVKTKEVFDIVTKKYRKTKDYDFYFVSEMKKNLRTGNYHEAFDILKNNDSIESNICLQFLIKYVLYGLATTKSIGENIHSADHVMATGFGWIPPLAVIDAFGGIDQFKQVISEKLSSDYLTSVDINEVLKDIPASSYDYRSFLKAK